MLFVHLIDLPIPALRDHIGAMGGVDAVYDFGYHDQSTSVGIMPDLLVLVTHNEAGVQEGIEALCSDVQIFCRVIQREVSRTQLLVSEVPWWNDPGLPQPRDEISALITTADIPGTVPARPAMKVASAPIITRVPGMPPSNSAVVHRDFSSQAGLASFGIGGLGHLGELVET